MCLNTVTLVGSGSDTLKIRSRMIHSGFTTLLGMDRIKKHLFFYSTSLGPVFYCFICTVFTEQSAAPQTAL